MLRDETDFNLQPRGRLIDTVNDLAQTAPAFISRFFRRELAAIYRADPNPAVEPFEPAKFVDVLEQVRADTKVRKTNSCWEFTCQTSESKVLPQRQARIHIVGEGLDPTLNTILTHGGYGNINPFLVVDWVLPQIAGINKACIQPFDSEPTMRLAFSTHYDQAVTFALSVRMIEEMIQERNKQKTKIAYVGVSMGGIAGLLQAIYSKTEQGLPDTAVIVAAIATVTDIFRKAPDYAKLVDHQKERADFPGYDGTYPQSLIPNFKTLSVDQLRRNLRVVIFRNDNTVIHQIPFFKDLPDSQKLIVPGGHMGGLLRNFGKIQSFVGDQIKETV